MSITKLEYFKYDCEDCLRDWVLENPAENTAYFCPYCGMQQKVASLFGEMREATPKHYKPKNTPARKTYAESLDTTQSHSHYDQDFIEPSVDEVRHPTTIVQKTKERLYAEDRMTHKVCKDGGWWNPVTKQCQGEGNGHNLDLDKLVE